MAYHDDDELDKDAVNLADPADPEEEAPEIDPDLIEEEEDEDEAERE